MKRSALLGSLFGATALFAASACTPPEKLEDNKKEEAKAGEQAGGEKAATKEVEAKIARGTGPIAKVNGKMLDRGEFDRQMDRTEERFRRAGRDISSALEKRLKENMVRKLVDEELIRQRAEKEGVSVAADELQKRFEEHKKRFGSEEAFKSFLDRTKQTEADVKADLTKNLVREDLFAKLANLKEPSAADAKAYYDENKDKYKEREQVKASHVLLKVDKGATEEVKKEKFQKAQEVAAKAKKGEDFAALAKQFSEGPTAKRGGDLGKFQRGRMVKAFEEAAFSAKPGEVVGPVETQFGYHVIKVFEKTPERARTFDEVKDSIVTSLTARNKSKATREILANLKKDAEIEVLEPGVTLKPNPAQGLSPDVRGMPRPELRKVNKQGAEGAKK